MKRWRRPTRPLSLIALLLLAGAVVNVAVAWVLVLISTVEPWDGQRTTYQDSDLAWTIHREEAWPGPSRRYIATGVGWHTVVESAPSPPDPLVVQFTVGLPLHSLQSAYWETYRSPFSNAAHRHASFWETGFPRGGSPGTAAWEYLPVRPRWVRFSANTLFYTAILALPLSFLPIRRRLRARRGRCPKCGYDLAGLADPVAPCPECGRR